MNVSAIGDARQQIADTISAHGLAATLDPATAHPPCALVGPATDIEVLTNCAYECRIPVWLIAQAPGGASAMEAIETALDDVLPALLDLASIESVIATAYAHQTGDLPAYQVTLTPSIERN